ncbi:unnamed protein product [Cylicocyclus nassatus]|uniref:Uncharacterized protein n=1 Tax=Cylicocyclus nassatus TaxID=53992 RepID=A0AA36MHI5_CYLNA|nr:unnamed protein product [Cylicocyclus nassatus]
MDRLRIFRSTEASQMPGAECWCFAFIRIGRTSNIDPLGSQLRWKCKQIDGQHKLHEACQGIQRRNIAHASSKGKRACQERIAEPADSHCFRPPADSYEGFALYMRSVGEIGETERESRREVVGVTRNPSDATVMPTLDLYWDRLQVHAFSALAPLLPL